MSVIKYKGTDGVTHELGLIVPLDGVLSDASVNGVQNKIIKAALDTKQHTLTAGTNITIVDNVISATGGGGSGTVTSVSAGTGLSISGTATVNPTVNIASTHKLPTTSEWGQIGDLSTLETTAKNTLVAAINETFTSVSNGKTLVAAAITDKGVPTAATATFATMATNIGQIQTGITPTGNIQLTKQTGTDVTNYATASVRSGAVNTPATTIAQSTPSISVSSAGLITVSVASTTASVTPNVSTSGWISAGTAGTITLSSKSATQQLSTQATATIVPTESVQTAVASGKYTIGAVTVAGITPTYIGSEVERQNFYTGTSVPSSSLGEDGDIYFRTVS